MCNQLHSLSQEYLKYNSGHKYIFDLVITWSDNNYQEAKMETCARRYAKYCYLHDLV